MANNLAVVDQSYGVQASPAGPSFTFNDMQQMATSFAQGGMFGSNNPHAVLSLMLVAQAEGKHPAQIMQDYHVISGKPAKKADAMLRDFIGSGGKVEWHELSDDIADATFSHPAGGSVRITWDEERVMQAQLGSNAMHKKYPRQMKRSRTVSEGVRTVYPGATGGFYVPEEVADFDDAPAKPAAPKATRARDLKPEQAAIEHAPEEPDTDKAREAADKLIASIARAPDAGMLDAFIEDNKTIASLRKDRPELAAEIDQAVADYKVKASEGADDDAEVEE